MDPNSLFGGGAVQDSVASYRDKFEDLTSEYADLQQAIDELKARQDEIKEDLMKEMNSFGLKSEKSSTCTFYLTGGSTKKSIKASDVEKKLPGVYKMIEKAGLVNVSTSKPGITVKVNKPEKNPDGNAKDL